MSSDPRPEVPDSREWFLPPLRQSMRVDLSGKTALVTGSARGIGRAMAVALGRSGANVIVNYWRSKEAAERTVSDIAGAGAKAIAVQGDVTSPAAIRGLLDEAEGAFGPLHILVNNAGVLKRTPFLEIEIDEWDWIQHTNLRAYFLVAQAVARSMVRNEVRGRIVNLSSAGARHAALNLTHYGVAKAGVTMLTKQMALELAQYGINVNEVNPGLIETDLNRSDIAEHEFREFRLSRIPLGKIGRPEDVVGAMLFLVSEEARLITGASLFIDGGASV